MFEVLDLTETTKQELKKLILSNESLISDDLADTLRDLCSDRLDIYGFDESYNPTNEGEKLENLIDKLYVG